MTMYRRFADPAEQHLANRWMAASIAVYGTLAFAIVAVAYLTSPPFKGEAMQASANTTVLQRTAAH
jgi:hypothetical protein